MNDNASVLTGGCLCGAVRYRAEGPPKRVSNCHCRACQRSNAAAFVTGVAFDPKRVAFTKGEPKAYASSEAAKRLFCGDCGTSLAFRYNDGEAISIWAPTLDDPEAVAPIRNIWLSSRLSWVPIDETLPGFPKGAARTDVSEG
jgi:hypothetical protein